MNGNLIGRADVSFFNEKKESQETYQIKVVPTLNKGDLFLVFKNNSDPVQYVLNADWIMMGYGL